MKNKILSIIGIIWGGAIVLRWLLSGTEEGSGAYQSGQTFAAVFGVIILGISIYNFFRKPKEKKG